MPWAPVKPLAMSSTDPTEGFLWAQLGQKGSLEKVISGSPISPDLQYFLWTGS
jgi:hypothetical protein